MAQSDVQAAVTVVHAFQLRLREQHPGLAARVSCGAQVSGDRGDITLMEIYTFNHGDRGQGIDDALRSRIEEAAAGLAAMVSGPRQIEAFDAVD